MTIRMFIASVLAAATVAVAKADYTNYQFTYSSGATTATGVLVVNAGVAVAGSMTMTSTYGGGLMDGVYSLGSAGTYWSGNGQWYVNVENGFDCDAIIPIPTGLIFTSGGSWVTIFANNAIDFGLIGWGPNNPLTDAPFFAGFGPLELDGGTFECHKVPAPGALALLGCAGLTGSRRRPR